MPLVRQSDHWLAASAPRVSTNRTKLAVRADRSPIKPPGYSWKAKSQELPAPLQFTSNSSHTTGSALTSRRIALSCAIAALVTFGKVSPVEAVKQVSLKDGSVLNVYEHGLTLNIVALRGSVPSQWLAEYHQLLSRYAGYGFAQRVQLQDIFNELAAPDPHKGDSAATADVVSLGDAWLASAIQRNLLSPIPDAESQRWWQQLAPRWQCLARRGPDGFQSEHGKVYGCPYRWGTNLVAYREDRLLHYGGHPVRDWADLLQPKLRGRVAFTAASRDLVGIALKTLGLPMNSRAGDLAARGVSAEQLKERVEALRRQALLFSNREGGRALAAGDAWALVGPSGEVLPVAERNSSIAAVAPESGTSLWADMWVVPRAAKGGSNMAGPSPMLPSWLEFTTMPARIITLPGLRDGASPLLLPDLEMGGEVGAVNPAVDGGENGDSAEAAGKGNKLTKATNFMPHAAVLARSEFLQPLEPDMLALYRQVLSS